MPKHQGIVSIGLNVDYQKALQQMMNDFKSKLSMISNEAKKIDFSKDIAGQIGAVDEKIERISSNFRAMFDEINGQKLDASKFEQYQAKITKDFDRVEKSISDVVSRISALDEKVGMLSGADFASSMKKQFDDLRDSVLSTYEGLEKVFSLTKTSGGSPTAGFDKSTLDEYKKTLAIINKYNAEATKTPTGSWGQMKKDLAAQEVLLQQQIAKYDELRAKMASVDPSSDQYIKLENELVRVQAAASATADKIQNIFDVANRKGFKPTLGTSTEGFMLQAGNFGGEIDAFEAKVRKMIQVNKEAQESANQTQAAFNTFQIKNGAIHVPVEVATKSGTLQKQLQETINRLQEYAKNNSIIAHVKLTLDGGSASGYKKNSDIAKQLEAGQGEPAVDISKAMKKTYVQAVREAEKTAKESIKAIQAIFDSNQIKITPNKEAFTTELSTMVNSSLGKIAEGTTGLNVNSELEKLVANLREVSTSLSGNESFKFGLDEASITRITTAIQNMADMIQRAFGVASNDDIAKQWTAIESKFKSVAGEEGKLLKSNKEHRVAIQELAIEYKKYLDMGGKNDLSTLTSHKQTVKNITAEYENLGKAAQEAAQKQEQQAKKKPASTKISSAEKESINAISRENKKLEAQAGKTSTALDNEGKSAQTAAEKFRKLAKEKGAAVVANRELAKAAKETADALEREARARKETGTKTGKGAVNDITYADNFLKWQTEIKQSLMDSGNYAGVYDAKISQAANGTVKFTAVVRDLDGNLKKLSANVNGLGQISSPSISDMTAKQAAEFEKALMVAERIREVMAGINGEGAEPIRLNTSELEQYSYEVNQILKDLGKLSGTTYKVDITNSGKLLITKKEIATTGAEAEEFTIIIDRIDDVLERTANGVVVSSKKIQDALNGAFDSAKISTSTKDLVSKAQDAFNKFTLKHNGNSNWSQVANDIERLKSSIADIDSQDKLNKFKQNLSDIAVRLNNIGKDNKLGSLLDNNRTFSNINEVRANIDSLFASMGKVNEKSIRVSGANKLTAEVKAANGEIRKMTVNLDSNGFARFVDNGIVQFSRLREAVNGIFKGIWGYFRYYLSPYMLVSYTRRAIDQVKEIDTAMTELRKVSDASPDDINAYFGEAVDSAKELGSSVKDMIAATADWSRMGYNLPDSRELGEVAVLYKNVGDGIDIDTANESLVSTIQGFQLQAKDATSVIDSFNEVSNNYAISSAGIGEALKRSAAAFNAANTDLNQSIALITAGNEIVQSPEKIGTMWQTVSARIRGTKAELEELGESTEDVISTSKLQNLVKAYTGVDIMVDKDTYKDIYTIVSEIGEKWKDLKDVEQAALLEALAGKKQSNTLAAVLNNAERLEEIYQTAENSAGSAQREQERYTESLQYSLDQLTAHGEEFWYTFINKDDVKDFIDLINTLISGVTKLVDTFGSLPTIAGVLGGFAAVKNVGRPKMFGLKLLF